MQKLKIEKESWLYIPNILCYIRILLIPLFMYLYLNQQYYPAAFVIGFSSLTDMFDGKIARKFNMISELGKILDPIADKLTLFSILTCFSIRYESFKFLVILLVVKEVSTGIYSLWLLSRHNKKMDGAKWYGKLATTLTDIIIVALLLFPNINDSAVFYSAILLGALMLFAFVMYIRLLIKMSIDSKKQK